MVSGFDVYKPCHFECEETKGSKQVLALAWWIFEPLCECCCSVRDPLHLRRGLSALFSRYCPLLVRCSLNAIINLVFAGDGGRLFVADVIVKSFEFRVVAVYVPNCVGERCSFFQWLELSLNDPKHIILVRDWNVILDSMIDKAGRGTRGWDRCESNLINQMA